MFFVQLYEGVTVDAVQRLSHSRSNDTTVGAAKVYFTTIVGQDALLHFMTDEIKTTAFFTASYTALTSCPYGFVASGTNCISGMFLGSNVSLIICHICFAFCKSVLCQCMVH